MLTALSRAAQYADLAPEADGRDSVPIWHTCIIAEHTLAHKRGCACHVFWIVVLKNRTMIVEEESQ